MTVRRALLALLAVVAAAAAVLSFAALRDLALLCRFPAALAPLLPVTIDAGAAAGALAWLGQRPGAAGWRFGRALALVLLAASVAGNAVSHALAAPAHWGVVVAVSAVAPAVLGAVVHLAVLIGRPAPPAFSHDPPASPTEWEIPPADPASPGEPRDSLRDRLLAEGVGRARLARELRITEHEARRLIAERTNGRAGTR